MENNGTDHTPIELFDGFVECRLEECSHVEQFIHPAVGLMKIQTHLEEEHGISEEEFVESLEECSVDTEID